MMDKQLRLAWVSTLFGKEAALRLRPAVLREFLPLIHRIDKEHCEIRPQCLGRAKEIFAQAVREKLTASAVRERIVKLRYPNRRSGARKLDLQTRVLRLLRNATDEDLDRLTEYLQRRLEQKRAG
jgi:hypothetical protein